MRNERITKLAEETEETEETALQMSKTSIQQRSAKSKEIEGLDDSGRAL
jgi:hypothetical protein